MSLNTDKLNAIDFTLTLRDWFAGMALQGYLARSGDQLSEQAGQNSPLVAALSYESADAMLAEREKKIKFMTPSKYNNISPL